MPSPSDDKRTEPTDLHEARLKRYAASAKEGDRRALEQSDYDRDLEAQERRAGLTVVRGDSAAPI
jgi:hypothetical protein